VRLYEDAGWLYREHVVKGKSVNQIAWEQDVGWGTIRRHLRKNGIPIQKSGMGTKQCPNLDPSPELSYILGIIAGDGCVSGHNCIELGTKDLEFAEEFREALKAIGLRANVIERNHWVKNLKRQERGWQCYANSVVFVSWFKGLAQEQKEGIARQFPWEYIRGMFESEGSYTIDSNGAVHVLFSNFNYELLLTVQRLLTLLGYESKIYERKRKGHFPGREVTEYRLELSGSSAKKHEFIKKPKPVIKDRPYDYSDPNGMRGRKSKTVKGEGSESERGERNG